MVVMKKAAQPHAATTDSLPRKMSASPMMLTAARRAKLLRMSFMARSAARQYE